MRRGLITVVETGRFLKDAARLMPESELAKLIGYIASNPIAGDVVPATGGVRKLRWALPGRGKSSGARVVYYYHGENFPVFLLSAYGKNEKANLSKAERNTMAKLVPILVRTYAEGRGNK